MAGVGFGAPSRTGAKATTDGAIAIDVRHFQKQGWPKPGYDVTISQEIAGRIVARIIVEAQEHCLVLCSAWSVSSGEHRVKCAIPVASTQRNYGGTRRWFRCLKCKRRAGVIYYVAGSCACRRCHDLGYASQRKRPDPGARARERAQKIRLRLGGSANLREAFPEKPKWMRWRTYRRCKTIAMENAIYSLEQLKVKFPELARR